MPRAWSRLLVFALTVASCGCMKRFTVPTTGMEPAIAKGDTITVDTSKAGARPPRGQIVVFRPPNLSDRLFVKRVVAGPGDTIEIKDKLVIVDGSTLTEPCATHTDALVFPNDPQLGDVRRKRDQMATTTVPAGFVFVLGDNRDNSYDSRYFGPVAIKSITGYVLK
jgi:signal peptidase I